MGLHKLVQTTDDEKQEDRGEHKWDDSKSVDDLGSDQSSSIGDDDDENWDDWISDSAAQKACTSLFNGQSFPSVEAALKYDKEKFGFDLESICSRLGLDFHGRTRLINYIRKEKPSTDLVRSFTGKESFFSSDKYLIPTVEDDPLLQYDFSVWSDDEDKDDQITSPLESDKDNIIRNLNRRLKKTQQSLAEFKTFVQNRLEIPSLDEPSEGEPSSRTSIDLKKIEALQKTDDDSHYFDSYGQNEIHAVMLRDRVRTATYASFIHSSPALFRGAIVLDVGCGTGILSLFAARAGATRVFAVDASAAIAAKARKIIETNGMDDIITVIHGKVEEITLPDGYTSVDVIVSEWMGYALLYESMLDSVLAARDRFLKPKKETSDEANSGSAQRNVGGPNSEVIVSPAPQINGGVMVPSQCRMQLGLCTASEVYKDRVEFWSDVYGYDMSAMSEDICDEAIVDIVSPETMLTESEIIKDIDIAHVTPRQLSFSAPFTLRGTTPRRQLARAFLLYFDTFFSAKGELVPPETQATAVKDGEAILAEVWRVGGARAMSPEPIRSPSSPTSPARSDKASKLRRASSFKSRERDSEKNTLKSFTTGPQSVPTHWKQTLFLLREPIPVSENTVVKGTFHCRKSADNSRELDVELHYRVHVLDSEGNIEKPKDGKSEIPLIVQTFKVR